jgi:phosphohistidine phosphatase
MDFYVISFLILYSVRNRIQGKTMRLYIVRHGIAELRSISSARDGDRALTSEGLEKMQRQARGMKAAGCIPDMILSSPLVRARQTAEILLQAFGTDVTLDVSENLAPGGDRGALYREIVRYSETLHGLMLVGHQPSLGEIAGELAWGSRECHIEFKKGGLCMIDLDVYQGEIRGNLVGLFPPSILRKL